MNPTFKRVKICTPTSIRGRTEDAKFRREINNITKGQRQIERDYKTSERKNTATQRGIISLLGNDVYLDPGIKDATILYGQNIPGFCYRRNGEARRPCSLYESKANRIIYKLDGKSGEVFEEQAANIVSDNPKMDEILSSPEILPILCDLRTTALLRNNKQLLLKFAQVLNAKLRSTSNQSNIPGKVEADPMVTLKRYRAILIQELFEALKINIELRVNAARLTNNATGLGPTLDLAPKNTYPVQPTIQSPPIPEVWKEALMARLKKDDVSVHVVSHLDTANVVALEVEEPLLGGHGTHDGDLSPASTSAQNKFLRSKFPKCMATANKELELEIDELKVKRREKFDSFVNNLITETSNMVNLGKIIRALRRKNPCKVDCSTGALERLLKDDSVFTPLNEEYCSLLHEQGALTTSEHHQCLVGHYVNTAAPKNDYLNPMTTPVSGYSNIEPEESQSFNFEEVLQKVILRGQSFRPSTMSKRFLEIQELAKKRTKEGLHPKSRRLACPACKAKLRQTYEVSKEREEKSQKQLQSTRLKPTGILTKGIDKFPSQITHSQPMAAISAAYDKNSSMQPTALKVAQPSTKATPASVSPLLSSKSPTFPTLKKMMTRHHPSRRSMRPPKQHHVKFLPNLSTVLSSVNALQPLPAAVLRSSLARAKTNEESLVRNWSKSKGSFPAGTGGIARRQKSKPTSWTLKVSRFDLLKLHEELGTTSINKRLRKVAKQLSMKIDSQSQLT